MNFLDPSTLKEISKLQAQQRKARRRCCVSFVAWYCVATTAALIALTVYLLTK
jgi:hypothetical protein